MNTLPYTAELAHRQAALQGEAELARRARRARRRLPGTNRRSALIGPPGLAACDT